MIASRQSASGKVSSCASTSPARTVAVRRTSDVRRSRTPSHKSRACRTTRGASLVLIGFSMMWGARLRWAPSEGQFGIRSKASATHRYGLRAAAPRGSFARLTRGCALRPRSVVRSFVVASSCAKPAPPLSAVILQFGEASLPVSIARWPPRDTKKTLGTRSLRERPRAARSRSEVRGAALSRRRVRTLYILHRVFSAACSSVVRCLNCAPKAGPKAVAKNAAIGGVLLALIEGLTVFITKVRSRVVLELLLVGHCVVILFPCPHS